MAIGPCIVWWRTAGSINPVNGRLLHSSGLWVWVWVWDSTVVAAGSGTVGPWDCGTALKLWNSTGTVGPWNGNSTRTVERWNCTGTVELN